MTDTIVIDFSEPSTAIPWARFAQAEQYDSGNVSDLSELVALSENHKLIVWLSGQEASLFSVTIPIGQQRHLQQILPSLLEDSLADDIDELHFAAGKVNSEGQVNVAVIKRSQLEQQLALLNEAGLVPQALLLDSLAVPFNDGWVLQMNEKISYLRTAKQLSYVIDTDNLAFILPRLTQNTKQPISLYSDTDQTIKLKPFIECDWKGPPSDKLTLLPEASVMAMNLLQGEFKAENNTLKYWKQWRSVVYMSLAALIIHMTSIGIETWQLNKEANQYKNQVKAIFKSTFPDEKRVVNAKAQMSQRLAQLQQQQDDSGFLILLQQVAPEIAKASRVSLSRINFERRLAELRLEISSPDYSDLELLQNAISALKLNAELGSVSGSKGAYTARLMIRSQQ